MADPQPKRTIGAKKKIGEKPKAPAPAKPAPEPEPAPEKKGGNAKKILIGGAAALALVGIGVGGATFLLKPTESAASEAVTQDAVPELGPVVPLEDAISINLAGGRYLRLGVAIQMPLDEEGGGGGHGEGGATGPDPSRVRDIAIRQFSGRTVEEVNDPAQREALRGEFLTRLQDTFGTDQVMDVYFTDFVTQ